MIVVVEESNDRNHKGREVELIGEGKGGETDDDMDGVFPKHKRRIIVSSREVYLLPGGGEVSCLARVFSLSCLVLWWQSSLE